jgi:hypothetical protein
MFARFGPVEVGPFLMAEELVVRMAVGAGRLSSALTAARGEGDFDRVAEFPLALAERKGEAVRETTGGVPVREGGLLGRLIVGLSHEEKKSSAGSPAGVEAPSPELASATSVTTTSSGYLYRGQESWAKGAIWLTLEHPSQPSSLARPCILWRH